MPFPPQPPPAHSASLAPYPLLSFVSYNHDILKLRLSRLHVDFLYHYKQYTERTIDDNRRTEVTRGHSIHVPGYQLDTYPVRKVWAQLLDTDRNELQSESKEEVEAGDDDEERAEVERAREHYTTVKAGQQSTARTRRGPQLGLSHHLFRKEHEQIDDEREHKERTEQRLTRKRARKEQWRNEIIAAIDRATRKPKPQPQPDDVQPTTAVDLTDDNEQQQQQQQQQQSSAITAKPEPTTVAPTPPPVTPARPAPSPAATNRSPSPTAFATPAANPYSSSPPSAPTSSAIPSLCEECGSRIDSMWSQCDFCGFDPLLSEGEEDEGTGRRRKKRGRAARVEKLLAQTALQEKKAKSQQEINKLMETMSPWETQ